MAAARPASRGMQTFQGGPVRPMPVSNFGDTKMMPAGGMMGGGGMMGTRAAANATRSGARPGSALKRVPTAGQKPNPNEAQAGMIGLSTDVKVEARPLTSGGLSGMASRGAGPGRQLADISYYRAELRTKLADITREIDSMNTEMNKHTKNNENYSKYERRYDTVVKEVRTLEGQLADFNLALDKHRTNTDLNDIKATYAMLKGKNDQDRKQIDEIFMKTAQYEKQTRDTDEAIGRIMAGAEERMRAAGEDFRMEYTELQDEAGELQMRINGKEQRLNEIESKLQMTQQQLKSAKFQLHAKGVELLARRTELQRRKLELDDETNVNLTPQQIKEKLLGKVKDANAVIASGEKRKTQLEESVESIQDSIKKKEEEIAGMKAYAQKAKTWEALIQQEKHFQELIDRYPEQKQTEMDNRNRLQDTIIALMKHSAKGMKLADQLPSTDKFAELKSELGFKQSKLESANATRDTLEKEREKRKSELHRVEGLDKKISLELQALKEKVSAMSAEMNSFKSHDQLAKEAEDAKRALAITKQKLTKQRETIKQQIAQLSAAQKKRELELTSSDVYRKIQSQEKTLLTYSQTNFQMSEFIGQRKRESEFESLQKDSIALANEINALLISQVNTKS